MTSQKPTVILRLDVRDHDEMRRQVFRALFLHDKTFLVLANRQANNLRWYIEKTFVVVTEQYHRPFDQVCGFLDQSVVLKDLQATPRYFPRQ